MKINRNDPCPCGSGQKYKKCCLRKDKLTNQNNLKILNLKLCKELIPLFDEYNYFELCRAVFAINANRHNRPEFVFSMSLNYCLCNCKRNGFKRINSYKTFVDFFNLVKKRYKYSPFVDDIVADFGEVVIPFNGHNYPVFLGTGHDYVFPFIQSLYPLSSSLKIEEEIEQALIYLETLITSLEMSNVYEEDKGAGDLYLPNRDFFIKCRDFYSQISLSDRNAYVKLLANNSIENTHFIEVDSNNYYPLFNPSFIIDYFHFLIKQKNPNEIVQAARQAMYNTIVNNFSKDPKHNNLLTMAFLVEEVESKRLNDQVIDFILIENQTAIFFINEEKQRRNINDLILKIQHCVKKGELHFVEGVSNEEGYSRAIDLSKFNQFAYIVYDNKISIENVVKLKEKHKYLFYDVVYLLYRAESVQDICDFVLFIDNLENQFAGYDAFSAIFETWLSNQKSLPYEIQNPLDVIQVEPYIAAWNVFKRYLDLKEWYPIKEYSVLFENPFEWIEKDILNYKQIHSKAGSLTAGYLRRIENSYLFLQFNYSFEKRKDFSVRGEQVAMINEILAKNFVIFEEDLKKNSFYNFSEIHVLYMPMHYAKTVDNTGFLKANRKYVYSDFCVYNGMLLIRFAVNEDALSKDLVDAENKSVECEFMIELLQCMENGSFIDFQKIKHAIDSKRTDKKDVAMCEQQLPYYYSLINIPGEIDDVLRSRVERQMFVDCKSANINPGVYSSKELALTIRKIQMVALKRFEETLSDFDKYDLHIKLCSAVAANVHYKYLNLSRLNVISSDYIKQEAKAESLHNIIQEREHNKKRIREIEYAIDTNLAIEHKGNKTATYDDIMFIQAFSELLIHFQDVSDQAYGGLIEADLTVHENYRLSLEHKGNWEEEFEHKANRVYTTQDHIPKVEDIEQKIREAYKCFYEDTSVKLEAIIIVLWYFSAGFMEPFLNFQTKPDVFVVDLDEIKRDICNISVPFCTTDEINNAIDFLIIDETKIKEINGKLEEFVPIWEREKRINRIETKPLVKKDNKIIFVPLLSYDLVTMWENGIPNFYLPYEHGLKNLCKYLQKWKHQCEKNMENDIAELFDKGRFLIYKNVTLHKIDKNGNHPKELGDYDLIAIDETSKVIWNIESKFLQKVGSIHEYVNHQKSFFLDDKKDEKFARRINYLNKNKPHILNLFGIKNGDEYITKDYMVTNKVFSCDLKEINFEIITFDELKQMLKL